MSTKLDVDVTELWREFKEHPATPLRNRLVERYLPLVKYNAERIWQRLPEGVDLDDLISAGVFGLMDAIDAFDLGRGVKFETYCVPRIRGAMLDELRTMDWVPRLVRSKHTKMEEARKSLEAQHGRPPTDAELAERLGLPFDEYEKMAMDANAVGLISLNKKWYETDSYKDVREIDILEDKKGEGPHPTPPAQRPDADGHQGPEPQRAPHHHPVLLRGADDEGDRRHARPERVAGLADALVDHPAAPVAALDATARVRHLTPTPVRSIDSIRFERRPALFLFHSPGPPRRPLSSDGVRRDGPRAFPGGRRAPGHPRLISWTGPPWPARAMRPWPSPANPP